MDFLFLILLGFFLVCVFIASFLLLVLGLFCAFFSILLMCGLGYNFVAFPFLNILLAYINCTVGFHCHIFIYVCNVLWLDSFPLSFSITPLTPT
jgi:hypothetical protein